MTFDDPNVYEMISRGETDAIFQLRVAHDAIARSETETFEDIIAGISLFRPGLWIRFRDTSRRVTTRVRSNTIRRC